MSSVDFCHILQCKRGVTEVTNLEFISIEVCENSLLVLHETKKG
jgi:hypothetical protein